MTAEGGREISRLFPSGITLNDREVPNIVERLRTSAEVLAAERSLSEFARQAWRITEPGKPFKSLWHNECIADNLTAVSRWEIPKLLINGPPRTGKSILVAVDWPCWNWIHWPAARFLTASHSSDLAERDNIRSRDIMRHLWFQLRWGHLFSFKGDVNSVKKYENDKTGFRRAVGVGTKITGDGGDFRLVDDPNDLAEADSEAARKHVVNWYSGTWVSRFSQEGAPEVVMGQRAHVADLSGHLLAQGGWEHVKLSMRALDPSRRPVTVLGNYDNREEGELLCPELLSENAVQDLEQSLGHKASGQLQQEPVADGGNQVSTADFRYYETADLLGDESERFGELSEYRPGVDRLSFVLAQTGEVTRRFMLADCTWFQTCDTALKDKEQNDNTALGTFCITPEFDLVIWELLAEKMKVPKQYPWLMAQRSRFPWLDWQAVEDKNAGTGLIQQAAQDGQPVRVLKADRDKVRRAGALMTLYMNGKVWHPAGSPLWLSKYEEELIAFPNAPHDDRVDVAAYAALSMMEYRLKQPNIRDLADGLTAYEKQKLGVPVKKDDHKSCDNPLCERMVNAGVAYCCDACGMAHDGDYEIHESGPLGHSSECDVRHGGGKKTKKNSEVTSTENIWSVGSQ